MRSSDWIGIWVVAVIFLAVFCWCLRKELAGTDLKELAGMARKRPLLFASCCLLGVAPVVVPMLTKAAGWYAAGLFRSH